jgi:hypothetical protein
MGPLNAANLKKQQKGGKKAAKGKGGKGGGGGGSGEQPQGNSAIDTNKREYIFQVGARRMNELLLLFFIGGGGGISGIIRLTHEPIHSPIPFTCHASTDVQGKRIVNGYRYLCGIQHRSQLKTIHPTH